MQNLAKYLAQHSEVNWIARIEGPWDFSFTVRVKQLLELSTFLDNFKHKFHPFLNRIVMAVNIQVDFFAREYLVGAVRKSDSYIGYTAPSESQIAPDKKEISILHLLSESPRLTLSELAQQVGISEFTARSKVNSLIEKGILKGTRLNINPEAIGVLNYYVLLYLHPVSQKRLNEFISYCRRNSRVTYIVKALGDWDYELNLEVSSVKHYREIIMDLTKDFSDVIQDYSGMMITDLLKLTLVP